MHSVLSKICNELEQLATAVTAHITSDEPLTIAHNNWSFPGLTRGELFEAAYSIVEEIKRHDPAELGEMEARLRDYPRRLSTLRSLTVPQLWGNGNQAIPAYMETLAGLRRALEPILKNGDPGEETREALQVLKLLRSRIKSIESTLTELEPRSSGLAEMIGRIEKAHDAADQLDTDLQALSDARVQVASLANQAAEALAAAIKEKEKIQALRADADTIDLQLKTSATNAEYVVSKAEKAYSAATSQGLAAAFSERSTALDRSMWFWVGGLVGSLGVGAHVGSMRFQELATTLQSPAPSGLSLLTNIILSFLSIGAPVWIAWVATKQIGQRFRLSEDYAFKASVSRAYEGYRREAARIDSQSDESNLESRLLESALCRLDEQPLRLVEPATHGSPWQELLDSDVVKDACKLVPDFGKRVVQMAQDTLAKRPTPAAPPNKAAPVPEAEQS